MKATIQITVHSFYFGTHKSKDHILILSFEENTVLMLITKFTDIFKPTSDRINYAN